MSTVPGRMVEMNGACPGRTPKLPSLPGTTTISTSVETIKGFKGIVAGEYDEMPEASFYMVGTIEEAVEKARKMAAEAA